jgi:hypothetical protein
VVAILWCLSCYGVDGDAVGGGVLVEPGQGGDADAGGFGG